MCYNTIGDSYTMSAFSLLYRGRCLTMDKLLLVVDYLVRILELIVRILDFISRYI